ncbi:MAG: hypothetical protein QOI09_948 [Chloroflexota bacterium]|nr:hypothetical protein [Chloroflexota bacterium]
MPHDTKRRHRTRRIRRSGPVVVLALVIALVLGACGSGFDPSSPCTVDGSMAGAYPDLEALVPTTFRSAPPKQLDSGRTCTKDALATLAGHGVGELRYAGGTWDTGTDSGLSLAIFTDANGPPLDPAWLTEFYEAGARTGKNVTSVDPSNYSIDGDITGRRIDVLNGESFQTVVIWPRDGRVAVALIGDFIREIQTREAHDKVVREAVDAFDRFGRPA